MKKLTFFIAALILLSGCREDPIEIKSYGRLIGEVLDANSLLPITGVSITTNPESDLAVSDEFGEFAIDSLLEGSYSIRGRLSGYDESIISVQVEGDRVTSIKLLMSQATDENSPPSLPSVPQPANGAQGIDPNLTLSWSGFDVDGDSLSFDVFLFASDTSAGIPLALETTDTFLAVENMGFNKRYYWQVVSKDGINPPVYGEVWNFSVRKYPKDEYRYTFVRPVNDNFTLFGGKEPDGTNLPEMSFQLTDGTEPYWRPKLRPILRDDMAALHLVGTEVHIYVMGRDGSNPQQVTSTVPLRSKDETLASYCWSPTGDQLLYMNFGRLYRINKDGSGLDLVAEADDGFLFTGVDWTSLNNNTIVATAERPGNFESRLYLFQIDSVPAQIPGLGPLLNGQIRHPVFSPSGKMIAFSYNPSNEFSASGMPLNSQIRVFNTETGSLINLSFRKDNGTNDVQPKFINGGAKVLFVNKASDNIGPSKVMLMDVETTQNQNRITLFENADMPDWN
ncbi:MAG: carboxypeptidase-like regulatory domain-containing protein [Phaeodactylibacter sp.]|nr:carboxypeptidase-like regulatory domain-containing protein [Phaeodactylibacter sp.]